MKTSLSLKVIVVIALALVLAAPAAAAAQSRDTESTVAELSAFHDVIYPIWHTAYPEKDAAALRGYAPEVKSGAEKIYAAKLPGILHERQAKWDQGLAELKTTVEAYLAASAGTDDTALLASAEALHSRYEMLVRIIRPVLKEVDAFHKVLYVVYHRYLPDRDYAGIREAGPELAAKAEGIVKASLPKRLQSRTEAFQRAAAELLEASKALTAAAPDEALAPAVESLHSKYQALEKVFE